MQTLHERNNTALIIERINKLTCDARPLWGHLNVAQMLSHCSRGILTSLGDDGTTPTFFEKARHAAIYKVVALKKILHVPRLLNRKASLAPDYIIQTDHDFEQEKHKLITAVQRFAATDKLKLDPHRHPAAAAMTSDEWSWRQYKHLDHHLSQFGV